MTGLREDIAYNSSIHAARTGLGIGLLTAAFGLAAAAPARAEVQITFFNGQVSLVAKDATLGQILTEWAKVGPTTIVNGERAPGGPFTLQLTDVPEAQALDILLRALSGYVAAPRPRRSRVCRASIASS